MPVCYRKVNGRYYSPNEYKRLKRRTRVGYCPRCGGEFSGFKCKDCGQYEP